MITPECVRPSDVIHYETSIALLVPMTRVTGRCAFIDTELTRQPVVPFDLSDVARAFEGGLASRFVHLEAKSSDNG